LEDLNLEKLAVDRYGRHQSVSNTHFIIPSSISLQVHIPPHHHAYLAYPMRNRVSDTIKEAQQRINSVFLALLPPIPFNLDPYDWLCDEQVTFTHPIVKRDYYIADLRKLKQRLCT
jgi:hypothetical protein